MFDIIKYPHDVLTQPTQKVGSFDSDLHHLIDIMAETMYAMKWVGLAAPQVAVPQRVLLIDPSGGEEANQLTVMINPRVIWRSPEQHVDEEGCLSLPGVILHVPRSIATDIEYHDAMGNSRRSRFVGFVARIAQHEIDHLDDVLMIDRVGRLARKLAMKGLGKD